jgi:hypothetical protein
MAFHNGLMGSAILSTTGMVCEYNMSSGSACGSQHGEEDGLQTSVDARHMWGGLELLRLIVWAVQYG